MWSRRGDRRLLSAIIVIGVFAMGKFLGRGRRQLSVAGFAGVGSRSAGIVSGSDASWWVNDSLRLCGEARVLAVFLWGGLGMMPFYFALHILSVYYLGNDGVALNAEFGAMWGLLTAAG